MLMEMDTLKEYIKFGLTQQYRYDNKLACVYCLDDFITGLQSDFSKYIEFLIPELVVISNDPNSNKELKLRCLMVFSSSLLYCTKPTFNHFDSILLVVNFALEFCCTPSLPSVGTLIDNI